MIPYGYCHCGCGQKAPIATQTNNKEGRIKGLPCRFVYSHGARRPDGPDYEVREMGYETPCWVWVKRSHASRTAPGSCYGLMRFDGRDRRAHRVYYEWHKGPVPDGLVLDHLCQVTLCVNPDHLEPVTNAENVRRGTRTKLSHGQVEEIIRALVGVAVITKDNRVQFPPFTFPNLAKRYGVSTGPIYAAWRNGSWT